MRILNSEATWPRKIYVKNQQVVSKLDKFLGVLKSLRRNECTSNLKDDNEESYDSFDRLLKKLISPKSFIFK